MGRTRHTGEPPRAMVGDETVPTLFAVAEQREEILQAGARALDADGMVIIPTETFYGLAVRADRPAAVARLAALKARGPGKPLPLLAALRADIDRLGPIPGPLEPLTQAFWPGPLTVVVPVGDEWPTELSAGTGTVGVRIPGHPWARRLAALAGGLITATSANPPGDPPATAISRIHPSVVAVARLVLDAGLCAGGLPSTVVAFREGRVAILRSGAVSIDQLTAVLGEVPDLVGG